MVERELAHLVSRHTFTGAWLLNEKRQTTYSKSKHSLALPQKCIDGIGQADLFGEEKYSVLPSLSEDEFTVVFVAAEPTAAFTYLVLSVDSRRSIQGMDKLILRITLSYTVLL
jgi:hypothetical protein